MKMMKCLAQRYNTVTLVRFEPATSGSLPTELTMLPKALLIISNAVVKCVTFLGFMNKTRDKSVTKESCRRIPSKVCIFHTGFSKNVLKRRKCTYNLIQVSTYFVVQYKVTTGEIYR